MSETTAAGSGRRASVKRTEAANEISRRLSVMSNE